MIILLIDLLRFIICIPKHSDNVKFFIYNFKFRTVTVFLIIETQTALCT
jgi:hypothetical protein